MARAEIPFVVSKATGAVTGGTANYAVSGASVLVNVRGGGPATVYAGETGATTRANPLTTTAEGRIDGWVDEGSYDLVISGGGITTYTQPYEANRGDGVSKVAAGAIGTTQVQSASITFAKLAADVITGLIPPGIIWAYAGSTLPTGWVWADGTLYNGTLATYLPLWGQLGTAFGGTGQSSFAVPDYRGATLVGAYNMGAGPAITARLTANNQRGQRGGVESWALTGNQHGDHVHNGQGSLTARAHQHQHISPIGHRAGAIRVKQNADGGNDWNGSRYDFMDAPGDAAAEVGLAAGNSSERWVVTSTPVSTPVDGQTSGSAGFGTGAVHPNMPPYQVCQFIIKL